MSGTTLMLHAGSRLATRDEVAATETPQATATWHPVPHIAVLEAVEDQLQRAGYSVAREQLGLARDGRRFFAALDLESSVGDGVGLVLSLRNSTDKSFPYGMAGGTRTFVCDNLALTGDWDDLTISRKHTRFGNARFFEAMSLGISRLSGYRDMEARRVERMRNTPLSDTEAYAKFMLAFEHRLLSHLVLPECLRQWREPEFDWGGKTAFRLFNAMNQPLQAKFGSNSQAFAAQTMGLLSLVSPEPIRELSI